MIALRARHMAHRIVNAIRFPRLPNPPPFADTSTQDWKLPIERPVLEYGRARPSRSTRELLFVFFGLLAIVALLYLADVTFSSS